jgi:ubiquinone/menaquinone biosynthesis C-methylase UbiE
MTAGEPAATRPDNIKQCCARLYESDVARLLLGESFHPGGIALTERLGILLGLNSKSKVLDVASGKGASAIYLPERFGCEVVGVDYSEQNVRQAMEAAAAKGPASRVRFEQADAERLPVESGSFDAIICECAFCTFPDKASAAREFTRVLRKGGGVGLSDLTRGPVLREELKGLLAWVACIADALPVGTYAEYLQDAGFRVDHVEQHDEALLEIVNQVRARLLGAEIMIGLKKLELPGVDFTAAKRMARSALSAVQDGVLGYAIICGAKG